MRCQCADAGCSKHRGTRCQGLAQRVLWRVDMVDEDGTAFCNDCAEDAHDSGLFYEED